MTFQIQFRSSQSSFLPAERPRDEDWLDTSYAENRSAIGRLRFPIVHDGRYKSKHPILDAEGNTVGFMTSGVRSLGYTFKCVYAGDCFWITHQGFGAVLNSVDVSRLSLVDVTGKFFFSKETKFGVVKSFGFGGSWVDGTRIFKLFDEGARLLYLTNYGFCFFDTHRREIVAKADFTKIAYQWYGFALSPKVKLLAIGCSVADEKDPIDGEYRYRNFVQIYNFETGLIVGEQELPGDQDTRWIVDFSEDGRQLRVKAGSSEHIFDLTATQ